MTSASPAHDALPDATWTVNEVLQRFPEAGRALDAFGVDSCCGGADSLAAAALEAHVPIEDLLAGVAGVIGEGR